MDLPDDKTWTWDQLIEVGAEVASKAGVSFGVASLMGSDALFGTFVRQHGKELFTEDGLGFDVSRSSSLVRPHGQGPESQGHWNARADQRGGLPSRWIRVRSWSGQLPCSTTTPISWKRSALRPGRLMKMLRGPSLAGKATERKTWYKASMLWSASAKTKNPEAAIAWINWFANTPEAANIDLAERGIPPNAEILAEVKPKLSPAQQAVAKYIADIKPEVGTTPIAPPPGGGTIADVLFRHGTDVLFGRTSAADGAQKFVDELKSNLQVLSHERHL